MNLDELLRSLASDDDLQVPKRVDDAVMAAWDEQWDARAPLTQGARARWRFWTAAAACIVAILGSVAALIWNSRPAPAVRSDTIQEPAAIVATPPETLPRPATELPAAGDAVAPTAPSVRRSRPATPPPGRVGGSYVFIPEIEASGPLTLMRVRMARRDFLALGVPMSNPEADGLVDVEVLVGEDGVARSIRRAVAVGPAGQNP